MTDPNILTAVTGALFVLLMIFVLIFAAYVIGDENPWD